MTVGAGTYRPRTMSRWHPWRALQERPDIRLRWERLPGLLGAWSEATKTITLHPDLTQAERRSTLTHEQIHAERGDDACDEKSEARVREMAARRLITLEALADALVWSVDEYELSEDLWVDEDTIRARLDTLTGWERDYIERRIAANEDAA